MTENQIATKILDAAFPLHKSVGPGLLESVYEQTFAYELNEMGLKAQSQFRFLWCIKK